MENLTAIDPARLINCTQKHMASMCCTIPNFSTSQAVIVMFLLASATKPTVWNNLT